MANQRLTDAIVRKLPTPSQGARISYDEEAGFGARVTARGARAYIFNYRVKGTGRERRYTIGSTTSWTVAQARERARELRRLVDAGGDPMADLHATRAAPTVNELADRYLAEVAIRKRPRSQYEDRLALAQWVRPMLGGRRVSEITRADLEKLHAKISAKGTKVRANRILALASAMFTAAVRWEMCSVNPAKGVHRHREEPRTRYLSESELARLMATLADHPNQNLADIIRLLILTGARKGEVLQALWADIDLERGEWRKPGATTKSGREHRVPLSAPTRALLSELRTRSADDGLLFPGAAGLPFVNIGRAWRTIRRAAKLDDVRLHDLRHSFASIAASRGMSLPMVAALLGHRQIGTSSRYTHLFDSALQQAVERVGEAVTAAERGETAEVVRLPKRK